MTIHIQLPPFYGDQPNLDHPLFIVSDYTHQNAVCEQIPDVCQYYTNDYFDESLVPEHEWIQREKYLNADVTRWVDKYRREHLGDDSDLWPLVPPGLYTLLNKYIFPFQFLLGVIGCVLIVSVLMRRDMRRHTANILLSTMAICDILLLFTQLPVALGVWYMSDWFRNFIFKSNTWTIFLANFCSCITSWILLAVSIERYLKLKHSKTLRPSRVFTIIFTIIVGSVVLTFYHTFEYKYGFAMIRNGTKLYGSPVNVEKLVDVPQWVKNMIHEFKILQVIIGVMIPTVGIFIFNMLIVIILWRSVGKKSEANDDDQPRKEDLKVTYTVLAIICCYFVTHIPSAIPFVFAIFERHPDWVNAYVANFFIFYSISEYFRRNLRDLLSCRRNQHSIPQPEAEQLMDS